MSGEIINQEKAKLAIAMNYEDHIFVEPNSYASADKLVNNERVVEGLASSIAPDHPGWLWGERYERGEGKGT
ncbi:hypothetical protein [Nostoc sp.]|uniref:hypothetical protein n=1 Tax=Nostoc sp. TaxID=1180 RepID=UPI002FF5EF7B